VLVGPTELFFAAVFVVVSLFLARDPLFSVVLGSRPRAQTDWERRVANPLGALIRMFSGGLLSALGFCAAWFVADLRWFWLVIGVLGAVLFSFTLAMALTAHLSGRFNPEVDPPLEQREAMISKIESRQRRSAVTSAVLLVLWVWSWWDFLGRLL
jgi:hypothetical protein